MKMGVGKAIEILRLDKTCGFEGHIDDLHQSHQMGIEALERLQDMRKYNTLIGLAISNPSRLLPSEDAEQEVQRRLEPQVK